MKFNVLWIVGLILAATAAQVQAGVILSASAVLNAPVPVGGFSAARTIDQSGLSTTYVSGVTDFTTYVFSTTHVGNINPNENFLASFDNAPANIDFDLGLTVDVLQLALWNYPYSLSAGIKAFDVYTSSNLSFAGATLVGSFTAADDATMSHVNHAQVFNLDDSTARYLRMRVLTTYSIPFNDTIGFSEVAFDSRSPAAVPEPTSIAMLGTGALGLLFVARKRRQMKLVA